MGVGFFRRARERANASAMLLVEGDSVPAVSIETKDAAPVQQQLQRQPQQPNQQRGGQQQHNRR